MHITVIHGQTHKRNTFRITSVFIEKILACLQSSGSDCTADEFFLPRDLAEFCTGCMNCFYKGESFCPHSAQVQAIAKKIDTADLLVFDSPCYVFNMSAPMKNLFDHFAYRWMPHRPHPAMFGKTVLLVSSAAGGGTGKTLAAMAENLWYWGAGRIFRYGRNVGDFTAKGLVEKIEADAEKMIRKIVLSAGKKKYPLKTKLFFLLMRAMHKRNDWNPADRLHWQAKGWLNSQRPWKLYNEYNDELWDELDENRKPTGRKVRRGDPLSEGAFHLVVHVCIFDSSGRLLVQKRQPWKKIWPGLWDVSVGGSAIAGDDSRSAAVREAKEELGLDIDLSGAQPVFTVQFATGFDDYWCITRDVKMDELKLQKTEVSAVQWVTLAEYKDLVLAGKAVPYDRLEELFSYKSGM